MSNTKAIFKKTFWVLLCILGIALVLILVLPLFFKHPVKQESPIKEIIEKTKLEIDKVEIDAQVEKAKAEGKEEAVIEALQKVKDEPDRKKRLEKLSQLLG